MYTPGSAIYSTLYYAWRPVMLLEYCTGFPFEFTTETALRILTAYIQWWTRSSVRNPQCTYKSDWTSIWSHSLHPCLHCWWYSLTLRVCLHRISFIQRNAHQPRWTAFILNSGIGLCPHPLWHISMAFWWSRVTDSIFRCRWQHWVILRVYQLDGNGSRDWIHSRCE